jgi:hypothetical protein
LFTRRLGGANGFRFGRSGIFRRRFGFVVMLNVFRFMRGKFSGRFRMWLAETAGRFSLVLRTIAVVTMIGGFGRRSSGLNCFRGGGNFVRGGRFTGLWRGTRASAAATSTAPTATAVARVTGGGGRV